MGALKNLRPVERSFAWLRGAQSIKYKMSYFLSMPLSYMRYALPGKNYVNYLGNGFEFDSRVTPLGLMLYPEEVGQIIDSVSGKITNVLDIGANIGQFAVTFNALYPAAKIDSFEPSPLIYEYLANNTNHIKKINTYCLGVGDPGKQELHYSPNRSVNASLLAKNATYRTKDRKRKKIAVEVVNDIPKVTGIKKYDLVKIDVEGYEYHTIKNLSGLSARYLYIEVTGQDRQKDYLHSELFDAISNTFGNFDILYITRVSRSKFELLLKFSKK